jgi:hypothetical protein
MKVTTAIRSGLCAASRNKFLVFIFFACNLLLAAAVAAPMHDAMAAHLGDSKMSADLVTGFSSAWLTEFQIANEGFLRGFSTAILYAGILFLALNTILSAGAFEVFAQGEGAGMHAFGRGLGKYFVRFLCLAIAASVLYYVAFWFFNGPADGWIRRPFEKTVFERTEFWLLLARDLLLLLVVLVVNAMVDYAKATIVAVPRPTRFPLFAAIAALFRGMGFVLRQFVRVMAIYIGVGLFSVAAILIYAVFARYFPQHSVATIFFWFLVAQVLLWFRWMFRLASWGATVAFYQSHLPVVEPAPQPAPAEAAAQV